MNKTIASHGGNIARAAREYGIPEKDFIDFSASINPLGPAPGVYRAITENLWRIRHYPDPECGRVPELLARHLGVEKDNLILGNGGADLIYILPNALKIRRALVAAPTFSEYAEAVYASGGVVEYAAYGRSIEEIISYLPGNDAVFICNPNNPTGRVIDRSSIMAVLEAAEEAGILVVVDEAFIDFVEDRAEISLMGEACSRSRLVVLYSMTKFFGVPGLRLGAAVARPEIIRLMKKSKDPWSVNTLAAVAGEAALTDKRHMEETLKLVKEERSHLFLGLSSLPGVRPFPSGANFLLVDITGTGLTPGEMVEKLGRKGILVRNCSNFKGLDLPCIRVAVRKRDENDALIDAIKSVL
ncbi:MAG: threonine-phosphate decarboxylase CobD [Bacillota bacterium]